jgi:predicted protein tyrosine phosphatase
LDAKNLALLKRHNITHVLTVAAELKPCFPSSFTYMHIMAHDRKDYQLSKYFDIMADFIHESIDKNNGIAFVHCKWGISRSPSAVISYLIKYHKLSLYEAKSLVKARREFISPNSGFIEQLVNYARLFHHSHNIVSASLAHKPSNTYLTEEQRGRLPIKLDFSEKIPKKHYSPHDTPIKTRLFREESKTEGIAGLLDHNYNFISKMPTEKRIEHRMSENSKGDPRAYSTIASKQASKLPPIFPKVHEPDIFESARKYGRRSNENSPAFISKFIFNIGN